MAYKVAMAKRPKKTNTTKAKKKMKEKKATTRKSK